MSNPPPPGFPSIDYVASWTDRLYGRLYAQYKNTVTWPKMAALLGRQAQDLEDAGQTLLTLDYIDLSEGAQLDELGALVGQKRIGLDDPSYRLYLRARIRANKSSGSVDMIYAVFVALLPGAAMVIVQYFPAALELQIETPITSAEAGVCVGFLEDSKDAGVGANFRWQELPDALMFTFAESADLIVPAAAGSSALLVRSTTGWPASGSVLISGTLANVETIAYTRIDAGVKLQLAEPLSISHAAGEMVEVVGDPGLGFGDSGNPATGGGFAGAATA